MCWFHIWHWSLAIGIRLGWHFYQQIWRWLASRSSLWFQICVLFALFSSYDHANKFKENFLSKHPNINFSIEKEKANLFQMLTFFVKTRHWELMPLAKRPSVGYTNFKSVITETYKIGLVWLLFRCFSLWLDFDKFYHEVHKLKNLLYENSKTATRVTRLTYILKNF